MSAIPQNEHWIEFFELLSKLPELWKVKSEIYKNKQKRTLAFDRLLQVYKKIEPSATVDGMRRKLNGMRSCFNRELRKVERSERSGAKGHDVYVPQLWYFDKMIYLRHEENHRTKNRLSSATVLNSTDLWEADETDVETEESIEEKIEPTGINLVAQRMEEKAQPLAMSVVETTMDAAATPAMQIDNASSMQPMVNMSWPQQTGADELFKHVWESFMHRPKDEAAVYAESWATSYRKLDEQQQILAKKAIEEIFVLGQIKKLEYNTVRFLTDTM